MTWASARDMEAERWTKRRAGHRQMAIAFSDLHDGFIAGWDACRTSLLSQLQAAEEREKALREALTVSRGQWIHSVNAEQCLAALALRDGGRA